MSSTMVRHNPKGRNPLSVKSLRALASLLLLVSIFMALEGFQVSFKIMDSEGRASISSLDNSKKGINPSHQENTVLPRSSHSPEKSTFTLNNRRKIAANDQNHRDSHKTTNDSLFSACLLIKDDNDILNEWIAYHYHVLNLRYLIVATDPFSVTSPAELLNQWRQHPFSMNIVEWQDPDYMPTYFLRGEYEKVPSFLPPHVKEDPKSSIWHPTNTSNVADIEADLKLINNHRFRQATFVSECFRTFREMHRKWVIHIDTDEYLVINPRLRARPRAVKGVNIPLVPHAGSVIHFIQEMYRLYPKRLLPSCMMIPSILFGATDNSTLSPLYGWNRLRFETLRWTYHADTKDIINGLQKAIVDVSTLPEDHPIFVTRLIKSVHQPLESSYSHWTNGTFTQICRHTTLTPDVDAVRLFPLTINHYLGSLERYTARQDIRRNMNLYQQKAGVRGGVDDGWIQGWLSSFVETYGLEASQSILSDYTAKPT